MSLREQLQTALKEAMKAKAAERLSTLRLINAAIKDREIALRGEGEGAEVDDAAILAILGKMVKQRQESARAFEDGGRPELAAQERSEIAILESFLPSRMDEAAARQAVAETIAELGAAGPRDMGRVMAALKERFAGRMDFSTASGIVKETLR